MDIYKIYILIGDFISVNWSFVVGIVIAFLSIIISIVIYIRSKRIKNPIYATRTYNLIQEKIQKIKDVNITYKNNDINNFSISRVAIWNSGKETINRVDIASGDKLRIIPVSGVKLLDAQIIYEKNSINKFSLNLENVEKEILINFDFFDFEEGIILQVFHTGKSGNDVEIHGTIKGFGVIKRDTFFVSKISKPFEFIQNLKIKYKKMFIAVFALLTPILLIILELIPKSEHKNTFLSKYLFLIITTILYWSMAYMVLHRRFPKGFDLLEEEIGLAQDSSF